MADHPLHDLCILDWLPLGSFKGSVTNHTLGVGPRAKDFRSVGWAVVTSISTILRGVAALIFSAFLTPGRRKQLGVSKNTFDALQHRVSRLTGVAVNSGGQYEAKKPVQRAVQAPRSSFPSSSKRSGIYIFVTPMSHLVVIFFSCYTVCP